MTCKNCKKFEECLTIAKTDDGHKARMYNLSFWETSDTACGGFEENASSEKLSDINTNL